MRAVDEMIRDAEARGDFDNLPGKGKPLHIDQWAGGEWGMAYHVLKQAGETLPWIALGRDIEQAQAHLHDTLARVPRIPPSELSRARERYLAEAATLDKLLEE